MDYLNNKKFNTGKKTKSTGKFIDALYNNTSKGLTENLAVTYTRSGSSLLDFYAQAGAMRKNPDKALDLFKKAFAEDREKAVRILFYLRDVRGGQGERDLFRNCFGWLGEKYPEIFDKLVGLVPEYGRWDDVFFDREKCFEIILEQLKQDRENEEPSLLAKWLPTINASSSTTKAKARFMAEKLGMEEIEYRKLVRDIRKKMPIVEQKMSANEWDEINYSSVPSQASRIYKDAFERHDEERYQKFIEKAEKGEVEIKAKTLYPYQIYKSVQNNYSRTLEALWNQLPNYTQGKNALVVADVSGSMEGDPMSVSVSLALYFAERNKGQFQNYFITFSGNPTLQKIQGKDLLDKMNSIEDADWQMNTNLQAVFNLILETALDNNTPEKEMPETIYIISDMEFDCCCKGRTNFEVIKEKYKEAGYKLPNLVFWNVDARSGRNLPVTKSEEGVSLVSGFSPVIFKIAVENKTPMEVMLNTINQERYKKITIK
ncbi:DUF2828 family protein [Candidatus Woesearchaeota archaeon]|nr:DUF2828 family protein [Candidatus Woesearchaeota archaeon]